MQKFAVPDRHYLFCSTTTTNHCWCALTRRTGVVLPERDLGQGTQQPLDWGTMDTPGIIATGFSHSVHLGAAYNQRKDAVGGPEVWVLCGGLENPLSVLPFSTICVTSAQKRWSVWVPTNTWDSVPQFSTCKVNKLNLPYIWRVWGNKCTDNHELPWILTWPQATGELQVTNTTNDRKLLPSPCSSETEFVPWSLKISACFKNCEGFFLSSMSDTLWVSDDPKSIRHNIIDNEDFFRTISSLELIWSQISLAWIYLVKL